MEWIISLTISGVILLVLYIRDHLYYRGQMTHPYIAFPLLVLFLASFFNVLGMPTHWKRGIPDTDREVLCYSEKHGYYIGSYSYDEWRDQDCNQIVPDRWMEIPDAD